VSQHLIGEHSRGLGDVRERINEALVTEFELEDVLTQDSKQLGRSHGQIAAGWFVGYELRLMWFVGFDLWIVWIREIRLVEGRLVTRRAVQPFRCSRRAPGRVISAVAFFEVRWRTTFP
jgi:hypothetical protein